jgi:hypothetical protein
MRYMLWIRIESAGGCGCREVSRSVLDGRRLVVVGVFSGVWAGRAAGRVVLRDIVVDEGFGVELSHIVV